LKTSSTCPRRAGAGSGRASGPPRPATPERGRHPRARVGRHRTAWPSDHCRSDTVRCAVRRPPRPPSACVGRSACTDERWGGGWPKDQ
jgi:hypothetical protein